MTDLFQKFEGADIDRLVDCLKAIRIAGLNTTKYTQAGVNQSSGNVWVWDEDWAGCVACVACSIGFDVSWYHSCPQCGKEHKFDTYYELTDYVEKYNGDCHSCSPKHCER